MSDTTNDVASWLLNIVTDKLFISGAVIAISVLWIWLKTRHPPKKFHLKTETVALPLRIMNHIHDVSKGTLLGFTPFAVKKTLFLKNAKEVASKTDVEIFGPQEQYVEAVSKFLGGLRTHQFSASGIFCMNGYLERLIKTRKQVIEYVQSHREILNTPFESPIIISGLPRTGSTMLYNLLSCDPNSRVPRFFEVSQMGDVCPPCRNEQERDNNPRIKQVTDRFDEIEKLYPRFFTEAGKSHYSHPNEIEEDLLVLFHCFILQINVTESGPEYREWYESEDNKASAYLYHYRFFQMLNHYWKPKSHWVLKAPVHTTYLNALFNQHPTARMVFTHRDPCEVVPSWTRFLEVYGNWFYSNYAYDRREYGRYIADSLILCANRLMEFQKELNKNTYIDVVYEDMIKDPVAMVHRIYDHFGLEFTQEFKVNMETWIRENRQGKHGRREYSLDDYDLTPAQMKAEFANYISHYKIPSKIK